jgi:hydroxylamine dehydrogenase
MKQICNQCHTKPFIDRIYTQAEQVLASTNQKVQKAQDLVAGLRKDGVLGPQPFQKPIDFVAFDLWHYDGRTSKHGAFMGGADFVQWHGNYELLKKQIQLESMAEELRAKHVRSR